MSSTPQGLKQRGGQNQSTKKRATTPGADGAVDKASDYLDQVQKQTKATVQNDWEYKLALAVITLLAFATRFYGITHPNQVVFDEVHFGKVSCCVVFQV